MENSNTSSPVMFNHIMDWANSISNYINPSMGENYAQWQLSKTPPAPKYNKLENKKIALGKMLFFDPRLSGDGTMSCATCHNPKLGWADGLPKAHGSGGKVLRRATPSIINVDYNNILIWDGREQSLEAQAISPITSPDEMHNTAENLIRTLKSIPGYVRAFEEAYWGLDINEDRIRRALASFQRTIISNSSPFDQWLDGDDDAMTEQQIRGFQLFLNPKGGNCVLCHRPPNFTDNGFHNIGLSSFGDDEPDLGRHEQVPLPMTKGAFKTPSLRNVAMTAPYFHDGSARTLAQVMEHYAAGGVVKTNISPNMIKPKLSKQNKQDIIEFMSALTGDIDQELSKVILPE